MPGIDDVIGQWVKRAERSGELKHTRFWGKKFEFDDGFEGTPDEHRMAHKVLKNAGYVPYEVELLKQLGALRKSQQQVGDTDTEQAIQLKKEIAEVQQKLALRLESVSQ